MLERRRWLWVVRTVRRLQIGLGFAALALLLESYVGLENPPVLATIAVVGIVGGFLPWDRWLLTRLGRTSSTEPTVEPTERDRFVALVRKLEIAASNRSTYHSLGDRTYWKVKLGNLGIPTPPMNKRDLWESFMHGIVPHAEDGNLEGAQGLLAELSAEPDFDDDIPF